MAANRREKDGPDHQPRTPADRMAALLAAATARAPEAPIGGEPGEVEPGWPGPERWGGGADVRSPGRPAAPFAGPWRPTGPVVAPVERGWVPEPPEAGDRAGGGPRVLRWIPGLEGAGRGRWAVGLGAAIVACLLLLGAGGYFALRAAVGAPVSTPVAATRNRAPGETADPRPDADRGTDPATDPGAVAGAVPGEGEAADPSRAGSPPAAETKVHVVGQVKRPGVVALPAGSRIEDAIDAAGGATAKADLARVNLARLAVDGEQVYVPARGEAAPPAAGGPPAGDPPPDAASGSGGAPGARVNLNTASETQLDALPGVGPVTAGKIVAWRQENGRFTDVEDLLDVPGIGPKTFDDLKDLVTV